MPRYIDADLLKAEFTGNFTKAYTVPLIKSIINQQPTADVQKIKHGKMNMYKPRSKNRNATYKCSVCRKLCSSYYNDIGEWKFCPHCGAKMDGGESK